MKLFNNTNFLATLVSNEQESSNQKNNGYSREFLSMLDSLEEEDCVEESITLINGKRQRLSLEKVKKLEKYFEVNNKLEPNRKGKIAEELGLQGRQVAIWFQNRRARLKSKQLEKEYEALKSEYDALKLNFEVLEKEKVALVAEVRVLKRKLEAKNGNMTDHETLFSETGNNVSKPSKMSSQGTCTELKPNNLIHDLFDNSNELKRIVEFKDGLSPSDSSERLNFASSPNWFHLSNAMYQNQFGEVEEQSFNDVTEESCNLFFADQASIMHWYNLH